MPALDNAVVAIATTSTQCNGQVRITGTPTPNNRALYDYPAILFTPTSIANQFVEHAAVQMICVSQEAIGRFHRWRPEPSDRQPRRPYHTQRDLCPGIHTRRRRAVAGFLRETGTGGSGAGNGTPFRAIRRFC
jgi:hypothetical protein